MPGIRFSFPHYFAILFLFAICTGSSDASAKGGPTHDELDTTDETIAAAKGHSDLWLTPGEGGFLSTWLKLGPFSPPPYIAKEEGATETWDPFDTLTTDDARLHHGMKNKTFELLAAESSRIGLKPKVPAVVYLAAIVHSQKKQQVYLSTASTDGIQVRCNGESLHTNNSHSRWIRRDVNLVSLPLKAGDNLLVIKLFKETPGRWSSYFRFMDEEFRRPSSIAIKLPGASESFQHVLQTTGRIALDRQVQLSDGRVTIDAWLQFVGAKPVFAPLEATFAIDQKNSSPQRITINGRHPHKTRYLLSRFTYGKEELSRDNVVLPNRLHLDLTPGNRFTAYVRIKSKHAARLLALQQQFAAIEKKSFPVSTNESIEWRIEYLTSLLEDGDGGTEYIARELTDTEKMVGAMAAGNDPYADKRNQLQRRGYRSAIDGKLHHYALYVPPGWKEKGESQFSLIVALHGLNGHPVKTISTLFGHPMGEDEKREERIRFPGPVGRAPMFVVAPMGFGSSGYYTLGEQDILDVIEVVKQRYRIDENRIYITGASMGGTGAAKVPLHYPDRFAAAVPLCGYHNLNYYSQVKNRPLLKNEKFAVEVNSNIHWVKNGMHLPVYMVHGTQDFPRQSQDLLEYYQLEGYDAELKLIDAGHNVWDDTYQKGRIFRHFAKYHRKEHPRKVHLKTASLRYRTNRWVQLDGMIHSNQWARLDAHWDEENRITITTNNAAGFTITNDPSLNIGEPLNLHIDGQTLTAADPQAPLFSYVRKKNGKWKAGTFQPKGPHKRAGLAGPISDAENEPLLFVYGTADPYEGTLARRIVGHLKMPRWGMTVEWPVKADVEVTDEDIKNYSLILVGTPKGNRLLARIQDSLPIHVTDNAIVAGKQRFKGNNVGAAFIYPNPLNPDRYVVVHTGVTREAIFYSAHLPVLLPDYVIFDASTWKKANGYVLGEDRTVLKEGFFTESWTLP